jgi:hypothetical protein
MAHRRPVFGLAAVAAVTACLVAPAGPDAIRLEVRPDTIRFEALGDTARPLVLEHRGGLGGFPVAVATFQPVDSSVATVSPTGLITSCGVGSTRIVVRSPRGGIDTAVVVVAQTVAQVRALQDKVILDALDAVQEIRAVAEDPLGSQIQGFPLNYAVADTMVVTVTGSGLVRARANGVTTVIVTGATQSATVVIEVSQRVARIVADADTLRFTALGETMPVPAYPVDSLGHRVSTSSLTVMVDDTSILAADSLSLRSKRTGVTNVQFVVGGLTSNHVALVNQIPDRLEAGFADTAPIQSVALDSLIPVVCRMYDRNGFHIPGDPVVAPSGAGRWSGSTCQTLRIRTSGVDTLQITSGPITTALPVALAVRPIVGPVMPLVVDQLPPNTFPWAPSARRNSQGQVEVYFAGYATEPDSAGHQTADLYRLVSDDGQQFHYDGVALTHDRDYCDLNGSGIENIDIVPRADGPGWRMFYAGGGFGCYGWQIFSAISTDERTWTKESGVRISNGGSLPPNPPVNAPWPAGEGMVTDQRPDGSWRMTVGTYEPLTPPEDRFQITEWRSADQLSWTYVRSLVTTRQLPLEGQRSAYSPTLAEIAPGLWRMIFTADDRNQPDGRSRVWSAVSSDRVTWQLEGQILGAPGVEYFYSALVGDRLYTLQAAQGMAGTTLVGLTVGQP